MRWTTRLVTGLALVVGTRAQAQAQYTDKALFVSALGANARFVDLSQDGTPIDVCSDLGNFPSSFGVECGPYGFATAAEWSDGFMAATQLSGLRHGIFDPWS